MKPARPTLAAPDHALLPIRLHSHPIPIYADSRTIDPTMVFVDGFVRFRLDRKKRTTFRGLCVVGWALRHEKFTSCVFRARSLSVPKRNTSPDNAAGGGTGVR